MSHAHSHASQVGGAARGGLRQRQRRRLTLTLVLTGGYMVAEIIGGWLTGSLALLADAGHMFADVSALALSSFALWLAERPAPTDRTYGYYRMEILAALANGAALVAVAITLFLESAERFASPSAVLGAPMMGVAAGGLAVNAAGLWLLHRDKDESLNVRGAWLHVLSDTLGSVAALSAGALIWARGWTWADPLATVLIAMLIVRSSWALLREAVAVLMEGAPGHIDVDEVRAALRDASGVESVHDLHVWTITSGLVALSCHVCKDEGMRSHELLRELQQLLRSRFDIDHVTIQIEPVDFEEPPSHVEPTGAQVSDLDEIEREVRADIERRGFHLGLVPAVEGTPGWAFSIGLLERHQHPELVCFGADGAFLMGLLETLAQRVSAGLRFDVSEQHHGLLQDYPVALRPVQPKWIEIFLGNAAWHYRDGDFAALQCFWPDRAGHFPWQPEFDAAWREEQPQLFHHETQRALPEPMIEILRKEQAL